MLFLILIFAYLISKLTFMAFDLTIEHCSKRHLSILVNGISYEFFFSPKKGVVLKYSFLRDVTSYSLLDGLSLAVSCSGKRLFVVSYSNFSCTWSIVKSE